METKNCPYCGGEIMKTAKKCKHCGEWLEERSQVALKSSQDYQPNTQDTELETRHSNTKKTILIIIGTLILTFVIWLIVVSNQKSDWEKAMDDYNSQTLSTEEVAPVEEVAPYYDYGEGQVCPYDGVPDDEYEEYYGNRTDAYNPNSDANAWE